MGLARHFGWSKCCLQLLFGCWESSCLFFLLYISFFLSVYVHFFLYFSFFLSFLLSSICSEKTRKHVGKKTEKKRVRKNRASTKSRHHQPFSRVCKNIGGKGAGQKVVCAKEHDAKRNFSQQKMSKFAGA